jgi:flagellin
MTLILNDKATALKLNNALSKATRQSADSLAKLSSGQVFTVEDPRPADRALAEGLQHKLRGLATAKRSINDAVSLLQTAESGFSEVSNMLVRMKEINTAAVSATLTDQERKFLFIEYRALFDEIDRIAATTEFNSMPLLDGSNEKVPERLIFRVGDQAKSDQASGQDGDWNALSFENLKQVVATTLGLGLKPVADLLQEADDAGISVEDAQDLMEPEDTRFGSVYDEALQKISEFRAVYGAMQTRLNKAMDYNDVATENVAAARSKIADVDYASEVAKLTQNNILVQTTTALMAQNNLAAGLTLNLIQSLLQ